jgi:hypothetical protein
MSGHDYPTCESFDGIAASFPSPRLAISKSVSALALTDAEARLALAGCRLGESLNAILRWETSPPFALNEWTSERNSD